MDQRLWIAPATSQRNAAVMAHVLADLSAGLGAEEAALYRRRAGGSCVLTIAASGRPADAPVSLPDLDDGELVCIPSPEGYLAIATEVSNDGTLLLTLRRRSSFSETELRLVRATLTALAMSVY